MKTTGTIDLSHNATPLERTASAVGLNTFGPGNNVYSLRCKREKPLQRMLPRDWQYGGDRLSRLRSMLGSAVILGGLMSAQMCWSQAATSTAPSTTQPSPLASADLLTYTVSASESLIVGYNGVNGASSSVNIAGSAAYVSGSERYPVSFVYGGGYIFGNNGQPSASFQNLSISQVINARKFTFILSDLVSYLPVASRFGISGVPGAGDLGTSPIGTGIVPGDSLLSNYGRRVTNTAIGSASYRLTDHDSIRSSLSYAKQHFLDGNGIENNQLTAGGELDHAFHQNTTIGAGYTYTRGIYSQSGISFVSQGAAGIIQHSFGPHLSASAWVGPQFTRGSDKTLVPSRTSLLVGSSASYYRRHDSYTANYSHGVSAGSGVLYGALVDDLSLSARRNFSENWTGGFFSSYSHGRTLANKGSGLYTSASSATAGIQVNRRVGEHWSVYSSYAAEYQDIGQLQATNNAFDGVAHALSFGVTFSPKSLRLGRR